MKSLKINNVSFTDFDPKKFSYNDTLNVDEMPEIKGVPQETRKALTNGTTIFERVLPGPDRMYPDTDLPPIAIDDKIIEKVKYIQKFIEQYLDKLFNIDSFYQSFHNYSSKKVNGEPLWLHTKNKDNLECPNPVHLVSIYDYEIKDIKTYNYQIWKDEIVKSIDSIDKKSDFNQENIIKQWNDLEQEFDQETIKQNIYSIPIVLTVSSVFYVRQFVRDLSNLLKFPLMANDINRTEIFL